MSDKTDLTNDLPHRPPMLLVDEVLECDDTTIKAQKVFNDHEFFFQGHYPDHPIVPGVILCECAVQAGAIIVSRTLNKLQLNEGLVPVLARMNKVKFRNPVYPGDTIDVEATLIESLNKVYFFKAHIRKQGATVATLDFACMLTPKA